MVARVGLPAVPSLAASCGVAVEGVDNEVATRPIALADQETISLVELFGPCESVAFVGAFTSDDDFEAVLGAKPAMSMSRREDVNVAVVFSAVEDSRRALLLPRVPVDLPGLQGRRLDCARRLGLQRQGSLGVVVSRVGTDQDS